MIRPTKSKRILSTFERIKAFDQQKEFTVLKPGSVLHQQLISIGKDGSFFGLEFTTHKFINHRIAFKELEMIFENCQLHLKDKAFSFRRFSLEKLELRLAKMAFSGRLNSIAEGKFEDYDNTYLRYVQPLNDRIAKIGLISGAMDLSIENETTYGAGFIELNIDKVALEFMRVSNEGRHYLVIDSVNTIRLDIFEKLTDAFFDAYSFVWGHKCGDESHILSSSNSEFSLIDNVMFSSKPKTSVHDYGIGDPHEVRDLKFSEKMPLFPKHSFEALCNMVMTDEKFKRVLKIIHEANSTPFSLSTCILFSTALETLTSFVKLKMAGPIEVERFNASAITQLLIEELERNQILTLEDKSFLKERRLLNLNKPTNIDRLELSFKQLNILLPEKFRKALKYRDKYLHGTIPKESTLVNLDDDNNNKAFELQFLTYVLVLKIVGYTGFVRNNSAKMEFYSKLNSGVPEEQIEINHPLYYHI
jgi:hypothetical protein